MLRRLIPTILLAAQFLFFPHSHLSLAQALPPSSSCPCTLQGSVVDSVSGQPVPHALVKLNTNSPRATLTDSEGKFQFEALPRGSVTLEAGKPGFLGNDDRGSWSGTVSSFQFGPDAAPAILKLTPESVIFGHVSDENGDPLEGITVTIFVRNPSDGHIYPVRRRQSITDDEGKFRIAELRPGSYFLQVAHTQGPVLSSSSKFPAPTGYAPVFYPGASDAASAVPLRIRPGRTAQANFSLRREPYIQLSGTVSGGNPQDQVLALLDSSGMPVNSEISFDPATSSFHTKWIPPGAYILIARSAVPTHDGSSVLSVASLHTNATSSNSSLHLTLQPTVNVPVVVRGLPEPTSEGLQSPPLALTLTHISKENNLLNSPHSVSTANSEEGTSSGDTHISFAGLVPGTYELAIESPPGSSLYAESAKWGSTDILRSDFVLDSSGAAPPIEIVVRRDGAALNGTVSSGDLPLPAVVVLFTEKRRRPQLVPVASGDRFEVSGLAPGVYRVFAMDASAPFDYEDPAFLAKISSKIQEVTLAPKQSASINLELATVGE